MITRKDLREDAAKVIDKAASLHLMRSRQLTQWQRVYGRAKPLFKAGKLASAVCPPCGKEPETQSHMWRCQDEQYAVIREKFMTKKDEEERKESMFTQTTLLLQKMSNSSRGTRLTGKKMKFVPELWQNN